MKPKTQVKNIALAVLERYRDESEEPYELTDPALRDEVMNGFERALAVGGGTHRDVLAEFVDAGIREADRQMTAADSERARQVHFGQQENIFGYDPWEVLTLGGGQRIRLEKARLEHLRRNDRVLVDNLNAQHAAFQERWKRNQAVSDELVLRDPRATVGDIVRDA